MQRHEISAMYLPVATNMECDNQYLFVFVGTICFYEEMQSLAAVLEDVERILFVAIFYEGPSNKSGSI